MAIIENNTKTKKKRKNKYWEKCGEVGTFSIAVGNVTWCNHCRNKYGDS